MSTSFKFWEITLRNQKEEVFEKKEWRKRNTLKGKAAVLSRHLDTAAQFLNIGNVLCLELEHF